MSEPKTIYCPKCGRKVAAWDGKSSTNVIADCRKCWKRVVFDVRTQKTETMKIPPRNCSSGVTFR